MSCNGWRPWRATFPGRGPPSWRSSTPSVRWESFDHAETRRVESRGDAQSPSSDAQILLNFGAFTERHADRRAQERFQEFGIVLAARLQIGHDRDEIVAGWQRAERVAAVGVGAGRDDPAR